MTLHLVEFIAGANRAGESGIIGIFSSEEKAKKAIKLNIDSDKNQYPKYPSRYEQKEYCYHITEYTVDEEHIYCG